MQLPEEHDARTQRLIDDKILRCIGFTLVFIMLFVIGGWAVFAPLESAAHASGVVTIQNYRKTVEHLSGGIIKEIRVRDGDNVAAGQPLIVLDDAQLLADYQTAHNKVISATGRLARLTAELQNSTEITFPASLVAEPDGQTVMANEKQLFLAQQMARTGQINVLEQRGGELTQKIKGTQDVLAHKYQLERSYHREITDLQALLADGYIDRQRMLDQQRNLDTLKSDIAGLQSTIFQTQQQLNEARLQITQVNRDFAVNVAKEMPDTEDQLYEQKEKMAAIDQRLKQTIIRAPVDGRVLGMKAHTLGGVVKPATPLLDIVPDRENLIIEARISLADIARVHVGSTARLHFSAFNSTMPALEGTVQFIASDRLEDEKNNTPYYLARIAVEPQQLRKLGDRHLIAGMASDVLVNTGQRTMLQYLLDPARRILSQSMIEE